MDLYAKGQLSFLILNCLLERDFYGLDFITEINNKSNGRILLKKPSVYSNLTRMEKQGYVSSYLKNSDLGPNRKYYSITESGRNFYNDLKDYFDRNNIDVFRDFKVDDEKQEITQNTITEDRFSQQEQENDDQLENEEYFDFSSIEESGNTRNVRNSSSEYSNVETDKQTTVESESQSNSPTKEIIEQEINFQAQTQNLTHASTQTNEQAKMSQNQKDDAVFLSAKDVDEYNKRIYDISRDLTKHRRKKSFAEDQISMTTTDSLFESNARTKANIAELKSSIENKSNTSYNFSQRIPYKPSQSIEKKNEQPHEDDGKFITQRIDSSTVEKARKIEPPRLKIIPEYTSTKEAILPAPKRDKSIDPSHKEILSKLYSRSNNSAEIREDALYDYNDLTSFYKNQNIEFNVYKKDTTKTEHNTNKLYLYLSLFILLLSSTLSAILYICFSQTGKLNSNTNFLFILLPGLTIIDVIIRFYNYKKYKAWIPSQMMPQWQLWLYTIVALGVIIGLNFIFGLNTTNFNLFATTLILPILMIIAILPIRYYLKRFMLIKYWK